MRLNNQHEDNNDAIMKRRAACKMSRSRGYSRWEANHWMFRQPWEKLPSSGRGKLYNHPDIGTSRGRR